MDLPSVAAVFIKILKLILNLIILVLYRVGNQGDFLGVGGTWNLNEEKDVDAEIIASGVFVGFFIYTACVLITYIFKGGKKVQKTLLEIIMNFVGTFLYIAIGGIALHYWHGYQDDNQFDVVNTPRPAGLAVGSLCVLSGAVYLIDTVIAFINFAQDYEDDDE